MRGASSRRTPGQTSPRQGLLLWAACQRALRALLAGEPTLLRSAGLLQAISSLVGGDGSVVQLNDKGLVAPLRVRLKYRACEPA